MSVYSSCKALVIGIDRYADPQYDLGYARSDAEVLADVLENEFGFDRVWALYDGEATKASITSFFERNLQQVDEDDGLVIFFAGHGITVTSAFGDERGFLVPHDGDPKQPYTNISLTTVRDDYLPMIPAKHVFFIVDACYGGLALRDVATAMAPMTIDDAVLADLTRRDRKVRQVLAAGGKEQQVLDGGLFGHSVFTGRLIEALREADPYITADHVGVHVRERVARDSLDRKHRQTPQFGYLIGGESSFVFQRKPRCHSVPLPTHSGSQEVVSDDKTHWLALTSEPEGAEVVVEGRCYGRTPLSVPLSARQYSLSAVMTGYAPWKKRLTMVNRDAHLHIKLCKVCRACGGHMNPEDISDYCPACLVTGALNAPTAPRTAFLPPQRLSPKPPPLPPLASQSHQRSCSQPPSLLPLAPQYYPPTVPAKSKIAAILLAFFLGRLGIHNLYLGFTGRGIAQLMLTVFTCGYGAIITVIWSLIEGIMLLTGGISKDARGIPLKD